MLVSLENIMEAIQLWVVTQNSWKALSSKRNPARHTYRPHLCWPKKKKKNVQYGKAGPDKLSLTWWPLSAACAFVDACNLDVVE